MTLALDGTPVSAETSSGSPLTLTLSGFSTTSANDVIVVACTQVGAAVAPTVSGGGLTWTQRAVTADNSTYLFYAIAAASIVSHHHCHGGRRGKLFDGSSLRCKRG